MEASVKALLALFIVVFGVQGAQAETMSEYWTYQEFIDLKPDQKAIVTRFSERVRQDAEPILSGNNQVKISVIYPGKQASDYWWRSISSFEARLRELNVPYEISPYFSKPGKDIRLQERKIASALENDPDYLIFTLDAFRHRVIIERIMALGRPKLILQNITTPVKAWANKQPFLYVGFDHGVGTQMLSEKFARLFPKKTPYALFNGTRGYVSKMRGGTFKFYAAREMLSFATDEFYLDFDRKRSRKAAEHLILRDKMPSFVFASSTDIALGIIDAAKEAGVLDKILVNGWGGGESELQAIEKGEMDFTVMRMNDDNGVAMAEAIAMDITGQTKDIPTVYSGDMELIEKGMPSSQIEVLRKRAFRYSDHWKTETNEISVFDGK